MAKIKGLDPTIINEHKKAGYEIRTVICKWCGETDDLPANETKCRKCGHESFVDIERKMSAKQTEDIINRKLVYKCPACNKMYDKPTLCCDNAESNAIAEKIKKNDKDKKIPGYYCTGCGTMYDHFIQCCDGFKMIEGYIFPNMTYQDYQRMSKILIPLNNFEAKMKEL